VAHNDVPKYLNEADVLVFPSYMEGSPNVIKEAMACNCPIVSTDVGDVSWVFGKTKGCYLASFDPADFAEKLKEAISFAQTKGRTKGRQRIVNLSLDMATVAKRLKSIYNKCITKTKSYPFPETTANYHAPVQTELIGNNSQ
jgi:glycosyltransferase involved in cell wall biosynthesis